MHVGYTGVHQYNLQLKNLSKKLYSGPKILFLSFHFIFISFPPKRKTGTKEARAASAHVKKLYIHILIFKFLSALFLQL